MNASDKKSIRCKSSVLSGILRRLGCQALIGFPSAEFHEDAEADEEELVRGGWLTPDEGVRKDLQRVLSPLVSPKACLAMSAEDDMSRYLLYYWRPPALLQVDRSKSSSWQFQLLNQINECWRPCRDFWATPERKYPGAVGWNVPQPVYTDLLEPALKNQSWDEAVLSQLAIRSEHFQSFSDSLQSPTFKFCLTAFYLGPQGWAHEGFSYIYGPQEVWRIRPGRRGRESWLNFQRVSGDDGWERCQAMLKGMLNL